MSAALGSGEQIRCRVFTDSGIDYGNDYDNDCDKDCEYGGNEVAVMVLSDWPPPPQIAQSNTRQRDSNGQPLTLCCLHPQVGDDGFPVGIYQNGKPVRFCGSGLLAATATLYDLHNGATWIVPDPLILNTGNASYTVGRRDGTFFFQTPLWQLESCEPPTAARQWLGCTPLACAHSGGEQGYWILECEQSVCDLQVDLESICSTTQRAIIVTSQAAPPGYDYELRYFAPQYGMNEDIATGSANAILACYWGERLARQSFRVLQRSRPNSGRGGVLELSLNGNRVEVAGRVQLPLKHP